MRAMRRPSENHVPTIIFAVGIVGCVLVVCAIIYAKRNKIQACSCFERAEHLEWFVSVKSSVIFCMCQVIPQFSIVSAANSKSGRYPQPAASLAGVLSVSTFDFPAFVPFGCLFTGATFGHMLHFNTVGPIVDIALLWSYPLCYVFARSPRADAARIFSAQYTVLLLELLLPHIGTILACAYKDSLTNTHPLAATAIFATFVCGKFD
jgi:hypothetical protein